MNRILIGLLICFASGYTGYAQITYGRITLSNTNIGATLLNTNVAAGQARPMWSASADLKAEAKSCVVRTYSRKEHKDVIALLQTPAWKPVEKEIK